MAQSRRLQLADTVENPTILFFFGPAEIILRMPGSPARQTQSGFISPEPSENYT